MGAERAVIVERSPVALAMARKQNIGEVIDSQGLDINDLEVAVRNASHHGFGAVYDSIGAPELLEMGLRLLRPGGTLVCIAIHDETVTVNPMRLGAERSITTSCNFLPEDYPTALALLSDGKLRVREWITTVELDDLPELFKAWDADDANRAEFKYVVQPR